MSVHVILMAVRGTVTISLEATTAHVKLDIKLLLTLTLVLVRKPTIIYIANPSNNTSNLYKIIVFTHKNKF